MGDPVPEIPRPAPRRPLPEVARERLAGLLGWLGPRRVAAAFAIAVAAGAGGWWLLHAPPPPVERSLPVAGRATTTSATGRRSATTIAGPTSSSVVAEVVVHVAGAVEHPGLVRLAPGARVADAVDAAGGALPEADVDALNLAAAVVDGTRIYVPKVGEPVTPSGATSGDGTGGSPGSGRPTVPVDLNAASVGELEALPGIGPSTAQAIVAYRQAHGPFRSVDGLLDVRGIGPAKLAQFRDLVTV